MSAAPHAACEAHANARACPHASAQAHAQAHPRPYSCTPRLRPRVVGVGCGRIADQPAHDRRQPTAFTHISPLWYTLNFAYAGGLPRYVGCDGDFSCGGGAANSFAGLGPKAYTARLAAAKLAVVPGIYAGAENHGTDVGVQRILDNVGGAADSFIASMVAEARANGYAGYNLDWELGFGSGAAVGSAYAAKFVAFVNKFKAALGSLLLTVDVVNSNVDGSYSGEQRVPGPQPPGRVSRRSGGHRGLFLHPGRPQHRLPPRRAEPPQPVELRPDVHRAAEPDVQRRPARDQGRDRAHQRVIGHQPDCGACSVSAGGLWLHKGRGIPARPGSRRIPVSGRGGPRCGPA